MMIKILSKIVAALMVVILGSLCMVANGAAKVYCRIAGIFCKCQPEFYMVR